ncbi:hypothetical protein, partial [uncultured Rikenella sp.]|uniref:hypothetical protein n=1 Tax=uncultured Rikenella sp. TaxID=368003 RepID=UPI00260C1E82
AGPTSRGREMLAHFNWQPRPNSSPHSLFARLRDSSIFGLPPKSLNRFFRRGARLLQNNKGRLGPTLCPRAWGNPVKTRKRILTISLLRRGARMGFEPSFLTFVRAPCAIHLYSAHRRNS